MRINVYSEEITDRIEIVRKSAEGRDFTGIRCNLLTHESMVPPKHPDDDSSAVTFWFDSADAAYNFAWRLTAAVDNSRKAAWARI